MRCISRAMGISMSKNLASPLVLFFLQSATQELLGDLCLTVIRVPKDRKNRSVISSDQTSTYDIAIDELKEQGLCSEAIVYQQNKSCNNFV